MATSPGFLTGVVYENLFKSGRMPFIQNSIFLHWFDWMKLLRRRKKTNENEMKDQLDKSQITPILPAFRETISLELERYLLLFDQLTSKAWRKEIKMKDYSFFFSQE